VVAVFVVIAVVLSHVVGSQEIRGMTLRWSAALAGAQVGDPVINGGSAYLADTDGNLYAVNAASGQKLRWKHSLYYDIDAGPAATARAVYVTSNGRLWAVSSATGALLWSASVPEVSKGGITAVGGMIYVDGFSTVTAVYAATGGIRWSAPVTDILAAGTGPVVAGREVYVVGASGSLYALDLATGAHRWQFSSGVSNAATASQPIVSGDTVYVVGGIQATAKLYALNASSGRVRWTYAPAAAQNPSYLDNLRPAAGGGLVYVSTTYGVGSLHALDAATGQTRWTFGLAHPAGASAVLANGLVYVDDQQGDLYGLTQRTGCRAWSDTQGLAQLYGARDLVVTGSTIYIGDSAYQIAAHSGPVSCHSAATSG
jgi:outer membrane protein assembly factor BamB